MRDRLEAAIDESAALAGFTLDSAQTVVRDRLLALGVELFAPRIRRSKTRGDSAARLDVQGLYVWGEAGRGKSWLLNAYFRALPTEAKLRVHFHGFLDQLHRRIHELRGEPNAVERAVRELTAGLKLLYFDEFHVHDPADATLLTKLLRALFDAGIVLLASSNYAPRSLLPDPQWHHMFEPGIDLILANMEVLRLEGTEDYRERPRKSVSGFRSGHWISLKSDLRQDPRPGAAGLQLPQASEASELTVGSRQFPVAARRGNELWITFDQLCGTPTSTIEYLKWSREFDSWVVLDLPSFADTDAQAQQRLINVVDVLCDADVRMTITSPLSIDDFRLTVDRRPDAFRMVSRLQLLQKP
ncbi:cell division protein ZapE [Arthrobacter sp. zg-Y820]|uniref:cell division protein ZapE n=1 Tax=unclassified Arthrobacter TaxID=235627 RepID=UPI0024C3D6A1|nr:MULTISPECIES: cell division protein ZapE [unclassified Arthrobacter]MDK1279378.1 cell division protein ZapE [Arthrobacter sp. zg.Y820]WIB08238.1 cell division protein ZapE [Arthrobacter sp. zg-Y820]